MTTLVSWQGEAFIAGEAPGLELIQNYVYPLGNTYYGYVEEVTFTFSLLPEQVPGTDWFRDQIINALEDEVTSQGSRMIALQVWEDKTPAWHTDYKVIATATASPVPWMLIIVAVLAILFIVALTFLIVQVRTFLWGTPDGNGQPPSGFGDLVIMMIVMMVMGLMMSLIQEPEKTVRIVEAGKKAYKVVKG